MRRIFVGLILIILSFYFSFLPVHTTSYVLICNAIFGLGLIYFYDGIVYKLKGKSLLLGTPRVVLHHLLIAGFLAAIIIEVGGNWIFKLWYYPYFHSYLYFILAPIGWIYYALLMTENYMAVVAIIERLVNIKARKFKNRKIYSYLFPFLGLIGMAMFMIGMIWGVLNTSVPTNLIDLVNSNNLFNNNLYIILLIPIAFFLIMEYLEYSRKEDSFLMHVFEGDILPFFGILLASFITSYLTEIFNLRLNGWVYTNWPMQGVTFLGIPVIIIAFWPFQYILFFAFYKYLYKKDTKNIWDDYFYESKFNTFLMKLRAKI